VQIIIDSHSYITTLLVKLSLGTLYNYILHNCFFFDPTITALISPTNNKIPHFCYHNLLSWMCVLRGSG